MPEGRSQLAIFGGASLDLLGLFVVGLTILGFGLLSHRVERSGVTPPMTFVIVGLLVGPLGFGLVAVAVELPLVHLLAEVTLVVILFTDASRISLVSLRREQDWPVRLLVVGLPLTILMGALGASVLFRSLTVWEWAVLASILAPTDAALGIAVINDNRVPVRVRQTLNVESGLNDGIALPIFLVFLSLAGATGEGEGADYWTRFVALQLILGPLVGAAVGYFGGRLVEQSSRAGWMSHSFQQLAALGLALVAFAGAELVGGNGFIAAFVAGLTLGNTSRAICTCLWEFGEAEGQLLSLLVFLTFGAVLVPQLLVGVGWDFVVYGALSLTLLRMVPTALSLVGTRVRAATLVFLGWFGPRGVASIVFVLLLLEHPGIPGRELIASIAVLTILLSVFAHGLSASPGVAWYARRAHLMKSEAASVEHMPVEEMQVRIPSASRSQFGQVRG